MRFTVPLLGLASLALQQAFAKVYFQEPFDEFNTATRWVHSKAQSDYGEWQLSTGALVADPLVNQGLRTMTNESHYALAAPLDQPFHTKGKTLVLQYSVRFDKVIDCSGSYIKLFPVDLDPEQLTKKSPYHVMFGPDLCGSSHSVKVLLGHKGKNYDIKKTISPINDQLTHLYTFILYPDLSYKVLIDYKIKAEGTVAKDWNVIQPKMIEDKTAEKPKDWDDRAMIDDPQDQPPEDYENQPEEIPDPDAVKPDDWDEEMDGTWEVPMIKNPDHIVWFPRSIPNPDYQGVWKAPLIENPDYEEDPDVATYNIGYVGFDLWQVTPGTIMDNIVITDSVKYARQVAEETWSKYRKAERKAKKALDIERGLVMNDRTYADDDGDDDNAKGPGFKSGLNKVNDDFKLVEENEQIAIGSESRELGEKDKPQEQPPAQAIPVEQEGQQQSKPTPDTPHQALVVDPDHTTTVTKPLKVQDEKLETIATYEKPSGVPVQAEEGNEGLPIQELPAVPLHDEL
ncbi:hypothetical protein IWQ61_002465 [Dispira simplex]|nr:hypothetical protein IWQ61_002465 [Dispira simplex]